jgi:hypothetical protein
MTFDSGENPALTRGSKNSQTIHAGGARDFNYGACFIGQQNGGPPHCEDGPIPFTVDDAVVADFTAANTKGDYFAADMWSKQTGNTGVADASGTSIPEPAAPVLLGLGPAGAALLLRGKSS